MQTPIPQQRYNLPGQPQRRINLIGGYPFQTSFNILTANSIWIHIVSSFNIIITIINDCIGIYMSNERTLIRRGFSCPINAAAGEAIQHIRFACGSGKSPDIIFIAAACAAYVSDGVAISNNILTFQITGETAHTIIWKVRIVLLIATPSET